MLFGALVKKLRKEKGLTQSALGGVVGLPQQSVYQWEAGKSEPDLSTLIHLADYFGVTTDYLLGRTNVPDMFAHDVFLDDGREVVFMDKDKNMSDQERELLGREILNAVNGQGSTDESTRVPIADLQSLEQFVREIVAQTLKKQDN